MTMLTLANIRKLVETDLDDTALTIVASSEYDDLIARYGDDGERTDIKLGGFGDLIFQGAIPNTIDEIIETSRYGGEAISTTLETDDYLKLYGGRLLRRLSTGTNPAGVWAEEVEITFTPVSRANLRNRVHCDLIKLALQFNGSREEWFGDYRTKFGSSYHTTREQIMRQMAPARGMVIA